MQTQQGLVRAAVQQLPRWDLPLVLWSLAFVASPVYIFQSGLPQPGDFIMLAACIALLAAHRGRLLFPTELRTFTLLLGAFVGWVSLVSLFYALWLSFPLMLFPLAFYSFNVLSVFVVLGLFTRYKLGLFHLVQWLVPITLMLVFTASFFFNSKDSFRQTSLFNNPNQLAYFAVLMGSLRFATPNRMNRSSLMDALTLALCVTLVFLSVSRGALLAMAPLFLVAVGNRKQGILAVLLGLLLLLGFHSILEDRLDLMTARLEKTNISDDRGYDRVWDNLEYLVFGAGEGANYRWGDPKELHSTIGTLAFSYGAVGLGLFFAILVAPASIGGLRVLVPLAPPMMYGLTHQGLRTTQLWVLMALVALSAVMNVRDARTGAARAYLRRPAPLPGATGRHPARRRTPPGGATREPSRYNLPTH